MDNTKKKMIIGLGNPLLDVIVSVDDQLLQKYCLRPNDAILAREGDMELFKEIEEKYQYEYFVGGAAQNSVRVAQWILGGTNSCAVMGCVGKDAHSDILNQKVLDDGVACHYQYAPEESTGICHVLLSNDGKCRSLVTHLGAASKLSSRHFNTQENQELLNIADIIYVTGFIYSVSKESIFKLAEFSAKKDKTFCLNLSAIFLCKQFADNMTQTIPYVDILFGNDEEASEYARCSNFRVTDIKEIAIQLAESQKVNTNKKRVVVITQGPDEILVATDGICTSFPVTHIPKEKIVDTNGAGDAFVGGYLAQHYLGKTLTDSIKCGIWAATQIIQQFGCNPPKYRQYQNEQEV